METNEPAKKIPCEFCKEWHFDDAGGYYDQLRCERNYWLEKARNEPDEAKKERFMRNYSRACYTGD